MGFSLGRHSRLRWHRDSAPLCVDARQMTMLPVFIAACLFLAAVFLLRRARDQRHLGGLPPGALIYTDDVAGECSVLVSHRYGIKGRPDALVRTASGDLIPV